MAPTALVLLAAVGGAPAARGQERDASTRASVPANKFDKAVLTSEEDTKAREKRGERKGENPRARDAWFYRQRMFPLGFIPAGARLRALKHMQQMMIREGKAALHPSGAVAFVQPAPPGSPMWSPIGPKPTNGGFFDNAAGRVKSIVVDPNDPSGNAVLIAGAQGGIWRTTNGLTSSPNWTPETDFAPSLAMGSIAYATTNKQIVYAGTGEQASTGFDVYYGAGVLKSTDGGLTWSQAPPGGGPFAGPFGSDFFPGGGARISEASVNPSNENMVLVGVQIFTGTDQAGIYCTDNGGQTWTNILKGQMGTAVEFASPSVAYAALGRPFGTSSQGTNPNGIYKATSIGTTCNTISFTRLAGTGANTLPTINPGRIVLAVAPSATSTVYASIADASTNSDNLLGIWKTTDAGVNWSRTTAPDYCNPQCWYDNVLKVHPSNPSLIFAGGSAVLSGNAAAYILRSTDGGSTWTPVVNLPIPIGSGRRNVHVDQHAMAFTADGQHLFIGNDGGVYRTDNPADPVPVNVTWVNLNDNLQLTQFYPSLSVHPSNPNFGFAGTQDNGSQNFTGSLSWTDNNTCGDGGWTVVDPQTPSSVYVTCQFVDINKSVTNGAPGSFTSVVNGISQTDPVNFIPPITIDPAHPQRLYFGTNRVWQTVDGGNLWTAISGDLTGGGGAAITALAVPPANSSAGYAGTDDGRMYFALGLGSGSPAFQQNLSGLPHRSISQIVAAPGGPNATIAFVMFSGFSGFRDTQGHIFTTTSVGSGGSWTDLSCSVSDCSKPGASDLPNTPVNDLVVDADVPGVLYAATDVGVFQGTCTANFASCTWSTLGVGLPNVAVFSLRLHAPSRTVIAATHGRGAWSLPLGGVSSFALTSISPTSKNVGDPQFTLAANGTGFTQAPLSVVKWNGAPQATSFVSANQLTATIPASLLVSGGIAQVTVDQSGTGPVSGPLLFTVTNLTPSISSINPTGASAGSTTDVTLTVAGSGFVPGASQVNWNGSTSGVTTNPGGSATTLTAVVSHTLFAFGGVNSVTVVTPQPGGGASNAASFTVNQTTPPPNDLFANAINVSSSPFTNTVDSFAATTEATDPTPPCGIGSLNPRTKTVWYKYTAGGSGIANANTAGSSYDTILTVVTGSPVSFTLVGCNDDIVLGVVLESSVDFQASAGTTYYFMISPFDPAEPGGLGLGGKTVLNFTGPSPAPPPADFSVGSTTGPQTVNAGSPATYTITVTAVTGTFSNPVNLTCSGLPTQSACTFNPTSVTPGATSGNSTMTVTTTARSLVPPRSWPRPQVPFKPWVWTVALSLALAGAAAAYGAKRRRLAAALSLAVLALLLGFEAVGCGGGGSGGSGPPPQGTPPGTYVITVTGTSSSVSHTTTVTLTVN